MPPRQTAAPCAPADFAQHLNFAKPWRPYQQRAIEEFNDHVADRHFHLVAAPGSGKTVMGLEVVRRLARPALVLTPTLAIREQWVRRLIDDFLPHGLRRDFLAVTGHFQAARTDRFHVSIARG